MPRHALAVVVASTRPGRIGAAVAAWFVARAARRDDLTVEVIDLADGPLAPERIDRAAAVVIVTAEHNHSFPGPLKTAIDGLRDEWCARPVGFVSYGGRGGGLRAVEHLRAVFAELHTVTARTAVSFPDASARFGSSARDVLDPTGDDPADTIVDTAMDTAAEELLDQLVWWAEAVRSAPPYPDPRHAGIDRPAADRRAPHRGVVDRSVVVEPAR